MIEINEKLKVFTSYLEREQQAYRQLMLQNARDKCAALETTFLTKMEAEKKELVKKSTKSRERDRARIIGEGYQRANDTRLRLYKDLSDDFIALILNECRTLIGESAYRAYLKACIQKLPDIFDEKHLSIYIKEEDATAIQTELKTLSDDIHVDIYPLAETYKGGFIVQDCEERIYYDCTLEHLVRSNKKHIGQRLQELMDNREVNHGEE